MSDLVMEDSKPLTATEIAQMDPRIDLSTGFCFKIPATPPDAWGPCPSPKRITRGVTPLPLINVDVMRIYFPDYPDYDVEARKKELQAEIDAQPPPPVVPAFPEYVKRPGRGRGYPNNRGGYGQSDRGNSGFNTNRGGYGGGSRGGFNQHSGDGFDSNRGGRGGYNQNSGNGFSNRGGGSNHGFQENAGYTSNRGGFNQNSGDGFASNRGGYGQSDRGASGFITNRGGYGGGSRGGFNQNSGDGFSSNRGGGSNQGFQENAGYTSSRGGRGGGEAPVSTGVNPRTGGPRRFVQ
uniref:Uncharacterized protein n=1 Tax=Panagrolaimus davidi TaxID=227884 RepID=A0A914PYK8_9BILA